MSPVIRFATSEDLQACLHISGACETEHVWQLTQREQPDQIAIMLSDVRLPRPMRVEYPRSAEDILSVWKTADALLVAEERGAICGFADLHAETWHDLAWVKNLIVAEPFRRQGIGSALLAAAIRWAHSQRLQTLMVEAQSQNWPAICFYRKHGFAFCGFNDRYYVNQIALFFTRRV